MAPRSKAEPAQAELESEPKKVEPPPPDEQPSGSELVVLDPTDRAAVLTVVDRHDEAMIVEELQRRALRVMLYSFPMDGTDVTDLSYLGVNEAVRVMNDRGKWRITIDRHSLKVESVMEDVGYGPEPCWTATVYAVNTNTDYGQFGSFTQPKRMRLKDKRKVQSRKNRGEYVDENDTIADNFSRQKAINKAQRNALRVHIPETMRQTLIAQYQGDPERVRRIEAGAGAEKLAELPPPLTDERAEAQKAQARALFDRIRELHPTAILLPASFHVYLRDAEHSHERLDDFLKYLQDLIDRNTEKEQAE